MQTNLCTPSPLRPSYHEAQWNKIIERNPRLERNKDRVRENHLSEIGEIKRKQGKANLELVFVDIKLDQKLMSITL